ncbi:MAG TPA: hypothetical protein VGH89_04275 [Pseudonocardia sp.]|jgi:hypothetical protein
MRLGKKIAVGEVVEQAQTDELPVAAPQTETLPPVRLEQPVEPVAAHAEG